MPIKHRILLVDDDSGRREILSLLGKRSWPEFRIELATNEREAIDLLHSALFSVVVTDIDLSTAGGTEQGGFEVLEAALYRNPSTQVVVITGSDRDQYRRLVRRLRGFSYIALTSDSALDVLTSEVRDAAIRFEEAQERRISLGISLPRERNSICYTLAARDRNFCTTQGSLHASASMLKDSSAAVGTLVGLGGPKLIGATSRLIGELLWEKLFKDHQELLLAYGEARGLVNQAFHAGLEITTEREFLDLPIELLHDGSEYLALRHPLTRMIVGHTVRSPQWIELMEGVKTGRPLRILIIAANTWGPGFCAIPAVEDEIQGIEATIESVLRLPFAPSIRLEVIHSWEASHDAVAGKLRERWDIVHYAGHALFEETNPAGSKLLFWENSCTEQQWKEIAGDSVEPSVRGRVRALNTTDLAGFIMGHPPALFYLSCCHSGRTGTGGQLMYSKSLGLVDSIVRAGVRIVVGHRWPLIDDEPSVRFVKTFYQRLLSEYPPDDALFWARKSVEDHDAVWASAVMVHQK